VIEVTISSLVINKVGRMMSHRVVDIFVSASPLQRINLEEMLDTGFSELVKMVFLAG